MAVSYPVFAVLAFAWIIVYRWINRPLKDVRGPPRSSLLLGDQGLLQRQNFVGEYDFKNIREYGAAWKVGGVFGRDILMLADPKAIQHILQTSGYHFQKTAITRQGVRSIMGQGIVYVEGSDHQRHRKIMNPAFAAAQLRTYLPLFRRYGSKLGDKLKGEVLASTSGSSVELDITKWLGKTTMDIIGEAAFDYQFNALDSDKNELLVQLRHMFSGNRRPSTLDLVFKFFWKYIPQELLKYVSYLPRRKYYLSRRWLQHASKVARTLVHDKIDSYRLGKGKKDVMSILVQANESEQAKLKMNEDEVISQMATFIFAGHETTASTMTWLLWELAKHPEDQNRVREEISRARSQVIARGDDDFSTTDLDSLEFTMAVIKEALRLHPIVYHMDRVADRDDVLPLSQSITNSKGELIHQIPVKKGQHILMSVCGYDRLSEVWGPDADTWNPSRFLHDTQDNGKRTTVGVFSNLLTFSAGLRACIGWRFSVIETQALLVELIETFHFDIDKDLDIIRYPAGLMIPIAPGREGSQMPLRLSLVALDA